MISIIFMIKKTPLIFFMLKQENSYGLLCVLASEVLQKAAGIKKYFQGCSINIHGILK